MADLGVPSTEAAIPHLITLQNMPNSSYSVQLATPTYPPVVGGVETHARRLSSALVALGNRVCVLTENKTPTEPAQRLDLGGIPVRSFGRGLRPINRHRAFALGVAWDLLRHHRRYDVAHFLLHGTHVLLGIPLARLLGKRVVLMFGSCGQGLGLRRSLHGRAQLFLLRRWADRVVILNCQMREEMMSLGFSAEKLVWLPCEVDPEVFAPADVVLRTRIREDLGLPADSLVISFTGRLAPEKQVDRLIHAFSAVRRSRPGIRLLIAGDGPERERLTREVAALGLSDAVRFLGSVPEGAVNRVLQASDIYCTLSATEGIPCAVIEAMSVGLPIVGTDIPGISQLIEDGQHGLLVSPESLDEASEALIHVIDSPVKRAQMGREARERAIRNYSVSRVADLYDRMYREILPCKSHRARTEVRGARSATNADRY